MEIPRFVVLVGLLTWAGWAVPVNALPATDDPVVNGNFELVVPGAAELCTVAGDQEINLVVAVVDTCSPGAMKALHWSSQDGMTFGDCACDGDPDREAIVDPAAVESNHNFWQAWPSPHQAYTADFDRLVFKVEKGTIPAAANVQVGFSLSPGHEVHPYVGVFWEGAVRFTASDMVVGVGGLVSLDPVASGDIICPGGWAPCEAFRAEYNAASVPGKHALLNEARIVQHSYWNFNLGASTVVIDDVRIVGGQTLAEAAPVAVGAGIVHHSGGCGIAFPIVVTAQPLGDGRWEMQAVEANPQGLAPNCLQWGGPVRGPFVGVWDPNGPQGTTYQLTLSGNVYIQLAALEGPGHARTWSIDMTIPPMTILGPTHQSGSVTFVH